MHKNIKFEDKNFLEEMNALRSKEDNKEYKEVHRAVLKAWFNKGKRPSHTPKYKTHFTR